MKGQDDENDISKKKLKYELDLKNFKVENTLNWLSREKVLIVKGKFKGSSDDSVLILEKNPFPDNISDFENSLLVDECKPVNVMQNDIYGTYSISGMNSINNIKLTVISPATEKHIRKYSKPQIHLLSESPLIYTTITLPFITKNQFSTSWVNNLIVGTAEADRVLYKSDNNSFVVALDFKWDGKTKDDLHCLAVAGLDAPRSLRDLRGIHLPFLRDMRSASIDVISKKYEIPKSQLRFFIHYPPSFYHLHVHVTHVHNSSAAALIDRAHLLSTVITNIESANDFYEHAILDITVHDNDPLYELYNNHQCFQ